MAYRQSLMKCAEMHGVKLSGWRYNKSRSYLCFWKARWDETVGSQSCRFRRPTVMSQQKFRFALRGSAVSAEEGWAFTAKSTWASPGTTLRWAQERTASPGPHSAPATHPPPPSSPVTAPSGICGRWWTSHYIAHTLRAPAAQLLPTELTGVRQDASHHVRLHRQAESQRGQAVLQLIQPSIQDLMEAGRNTPASPALK